MSISRTANSCECNCVKATRQVRLAWLAVLGVAVVGLTATAQPTNRPTPTNAPPHVEPAPPPLVDEASFRIIAERNVFNASRSGGSVRLASRRPASVESFTLVGTMAYAKGAFAFFEGSSSEFTKVVKAAGIIAGHKLSDIFAGSVKLEADGKSVDLPIGSQMRREDAGVWLVVAGVNGGGSASGRSTTTEPSGEAPAAAAPATTAAQSEILKRLMERRAKE
jgi:hypothetical protein